MSCSQPASAYFDAVTAYNSSTSCARVTVFQADAIGKGTRHLADSHDISPGRHYRFLWMSLPGGAMGTILKPYTVLARFEMFPSADCHGSPVGRNHEMKKQDSNPFKGNTWRVRVLGEPGRYYLRG